VCFVQCLGVHRSTSEILQRQKRNWIIESFNIDEGNTKPYPYHLGNIKKENNLTLFKISGHGVDEEPIGILRINEFTGEITVHGPVDYEKYQTLEVKFQAFDRENHLLDTQLGIEIIVKDANDNPPKFDRKMYEVTIKESTLQGTEVITIKAEDDDSDKINKMFDLKIVSVIPQQQDLKFYITQKADAQTGTISFYGCLDHEKAEKYTILVEAKDRGEPEKLSSTCTVIINVEDGNNHPPVITGQTGPGKVKEGQENVLVSRLKITDEDTKGTAAWRVKYQIQGDTNNNFRITTDLETNEGLLYVEKPLNYEDGAEKNVTVIVENDIPYYSCEVVSRSATGLWKLITFSGVTSGGASLTGQARGLTSLLVTITVEDVNESPIFDKPYKQIKLVENVAAGLYLETFTARDPDVKTRVCFRYMKGEDPAGWVTVDPVTGTITTLKIIDRESSFVKDNIYKVTIYAVDDGKPPMTGTATLNIFISDENDNAPSLTVSTIDMCQSSGSSLANITALDPDGDPYGGPFFFKLSGDVQGKWKVDPDKGYSVNLVKENTVHSGYHELLLEVSDRQGVTAVHNLSVTVCDCLDAARPNCHVRKVTGSTPGGGAFVVIIFGMLLFAGRRHSHNKRISMLYTLQAPGEELGDYAPHVYAEEGDIETNFEVDAISIPDIPFDPDLDLDLDLKFSTLAKICMANVSTAYSEKNFYVIEKHQTTGLIQVESQLK
ncbi:cadherin-like protein 26, partial [Thunnus thynnus]|uniref:cadherin-like protein 26 n=1 Tax=Thunnus thynnus TaxID=8237 RepID=UPI00352872F1